jgi:hypothetical protein
LNAKALNGTEQVSNPSQVLQWSMHGPSSCYHAQSVALLKIKIPWSLSSYTIGVLRRRYFTLQCELVGATTMVV